MGIAGDDHVDLRITEAVDRSEAGLLKVLSSKGATRRRLEVTLKRQCAFALMKGECSLDQPRCIFAGVSDSSSIVITQSFAQIFGIACVMPVGKANRTQDVYVIKTSHTDGLPNRPAMA